MCLNSRQIFLVAAVLSICSAYAQNDDKAVLERIFRQELNEDNDQPLRKEQFSVGVSELPQWFLNIPVSTDKVSYAIGISDPEMEDSLKAQKQALQRALLQLSLMSGASISGVSDLYNRDSQNKYEEYYKFKGSPKVEGACSVVDSFTTCFREKVLLLKLDKSVHKRFNINAAVEVYRSNTKIEIGWCSSAKVNYFAETDSCKTYYESSQDEPNFQLISVFNSDSICIPAYRYEYKVMKPDSLGNKYDSVIKLHQKGLWFGYFQSFLEGLQMTASNNRSNLKSMDELHSNSKGKYNINTINRDIVQNNMSFCIQKIETPYNQFKITFIISKQSI